MSLEMITSIIVTHNARLRCLITKLFNKSSLITDTVKREQFKEYRWQNCCVLKLDLKPNGEQYNFTLSLIYQGKIDPTERKEYHYWSNQDGFEELEPKPLGCIGSICSKKSTVRPTPMRVFHKFEDLIGDVKLRDLADTDIGNNFNANKDYVFYLVRHGQAEHNLYTGTTVFRKIDTSLTENGRSTTKAAGNAINEDLIKTTSKLIYYFASDLIRTRQTLQGVLNGIDSSNLYLETRANIINIIILPCSHELAFVSNGNCDSNVNVGQPFTSENKMSCTKLNNYSNSTSQFKDCVTFNCVTADNVNIVANLIWTLYYQFYGNSYRGDTTKKIYGTKKQCRNTSMIEEAIKYIQQPNQVAGRKSRRRKNVCRRKTRKYKRKK
jgi:bisphosphoglycerate-dependent phosphoglycerate mutase